MQEDQWLTFSGFEVMDIDAVGLDLTPFKLNG